MDDKKIVLDSYVKEELNKVRGIIAGSPRNGLYDTVISRLSNGTRNSPAQIEYLGAYEQAVGVFRAAALELRKAMDVLTLEQRLGAQNASLHRAKTEMPKTSLREEQEVADGLQKEISDAVFFSNRYALCFAGHVGLSLLNSERAQIKNQFSFGTAYDASTDRDVLSGMLANVARDDLLRVIGDKSRGSKPNDDDLKFTLEAIFTSWTNQFNWLTFKDTAKKYGVDAVSLAYDNYSMKAGDFKRKHSAVIVDDRFMKITKDEVIGSTDLSRILWQNLLMLGAFDQDRKKNPYNPAKVIFTYGEPGCGKTFVAHAYINSFAELCKQKGVSCWALTHSTTDYASHYQNQTANELSALAGKINAFPGCVVMYVADADNIFQSRKDPRLTAEQQQTLAVYFKMFDGTLIPRNGKFMAVMDANYIEGIDDATKSRLFDEIVELKRFEKADDFADIAQRTLSKEIDGIEIARQDWLEVGKYLLASPLSNREIGHILQKMCRISVPEEMFGKNWDDHVVYRTTQLKGLTKDKIISTFDDYVEKRMELERKSYEAKRADDTQRFLQYLATQSSKTGERGA